LPGGKDDSLREWDDSLREGWVDDSFGIGMTNQVDEFLRNGWLDE